MNNNQSIEYYKNYLSSLDDIEIDVLKLFIEDNRLFIYLSHIQEKQEFNTIEYSYIFQKIKLDNLNILYSLLINLELKEKNIEIFKKILSEIIYIINNDVIFKIPYNSIINKIIKNSFIENVEYLYNGNINIDIKILKVNDILNINERTNWNINYDKNSKIIFQLQLNKKINGIYIKSLFDHLDFLIQPISTKLIKIENHQIYKFKIL